MSNMVVMGRVVAPYGILGWLKIAPDTETLNSLFDYDTWWLGKDEDWREMVVETAKIHNDVLLVKFEGIEDRDAAFACKSKQIAVPRELLPEPGENEYYWSDLIGLQVKNQNNVDFGLITDVFETGANDVLVIKNKAHEKEKQERLLPFIADVVLEVDLEAKTMSVDWDENF